MLYPFDHPFWQNLTQDEADWYALFLKKSGSWIAWISTKEKDRVGPEPPRPTDSEWIESDRLATKGWAK